MKSTELTKQLNFKDKKSFALIEFQGEKGIAILLGENLVTGTWLSGDIIVFWENGDHTILPEEFDLIKLDIFK